jgi:hypothetical protein
MDYLEFIARITSHIPDKGQLMIRYYGISANVHRGKKKKGGGQMRIIFFIKDYEVINKIIDYLKLIFKAECPPPTKAQLSMASEERIEYI